MGAPIRDDRLLAGRYRIGPLLGRGAMAQVYDGVDTRLERSVAIKIMRPDPGLPGEVGARVAHEARAAARLSHPQVVTVYDAGIHGATAYIIMERLPGATLADHLGAGPVASPWILPLVDDVLAALSGAHGAGLTHRDVKPGNILLTGDGRAKVGDFGIAKVAGRGDHTATGLVLGTVAYLPPERLAGAPASPQGDLYATGIVLYEALAGTKPYSGDNPLIVAQAIQAAEPADLAALRPDLPPALVATIARAMAKDPADRFVSAAAMAAELRRASCPALVPVTAWAGRAAPVDLGGTGAPTALLPPPPRTELTTAPAPPARRRRARAGLAAAILVVLAAAAAVAATAGSGGRRAPAGSAGHTPPRLAGPSLAPATTQPADPAATAPSNVPSTAGPSPAQAAVSPSATPADSASAGLQRVAARLDAAPGTKGSPAAAAILLQVAGTPVPLRPAAAAAGAADLRALLGSGAIARPAYHQAIQALTTFAGAPAPGGGGSGD